MRYLQCPNELDLNNLGPHVHKIFMAGGITGVGDWQSEVIGKIFSPRYVYKDLVFINPRRADFDIDDPGSAEKQIEWEHRYLNQVDEIYFWFPKEAKCMITLFELGWALGANKKVKIACHPEYMRAFDVQEQVKLRAPWIKIYESLDELYENFYVL